ncbi:hypothetical protein V6N12_013504 [Hibiscus sabdariffa]|uniref:Uncharacterized protein n=1 Tax=Hibiscus sabdariffa TaxID=183260 RepID=A0ABR2C9K8_9ROSI
MTLGSINYPPSSKEISADFQGCGRRVSDVDLTASCFLAGKSNALLQLLPAIKYLPEIFSAWAGLCWADALGFFVSFLLGFSIYSST